MSETSTPGARLETIEDGQILHLTLEFGKGNIIDLNAIGELRAAAVEIATMSGLKAVVLDHAGDHFSFGASVERAKADRPPIALLADRIVSAPTAFFGQPEIRLAVFAPLASLLLPARIGRSRAFDLLLSGRSIDAVAAREIGLIDEIAGDPLVATLHWARKQLVPKSAAAIRLATRAARMPWRPTFEHDLQAVERLYLDELMATDDALEGIRAFLDRREPIWQDR